MNADTWIRRTHRWLSLAFVLAVLANIAAMMMKSSEVWIGLMALVPLIPLMATGLYMFVRPYLSRGS